MGILNVEIVIHKIFNFQMSQWRKLVEMHYRTLQALRFGPQRIKLCHFDVNIYNKEAEYVILLFNLFK